MGVLSNGLSGISSGINFSSIATVLIVVFIAFAILGLITALVLYYIYLRSFKNIAHIYKEVQGKTQLVLVDKFKQIKLGNAGDVIIKLKKAKKILPFPNIQSGKRLYLFYVTSDGEWYNIGVENFNTKRKELGLHFTDADMRYSRLAIEEAMKQKLTLKSFWDKYGGMITYGMFVLLITICLVVLFSQGGKFYDGMIRSVEAMTHYTEMVAQTFNQTVSNNISNSGLVRV